MPLERPCDCAKNGFSGTETVGTAVALAATGGTDASRVSGAIKAVSSDPFTITQAGTDSTNTAAVKTTTDTAANVGQGNFTITLANTGEAVTLAVGGTTAAAWQTAIDASSLVGQITAAIDGNNKLVLTGASTLGDFTLTDPAGNAEGLAANTAGTEGTGRGYFVTGTAALSKVSDISATSGWSRPSNFGCRRGPRHSSANARQPWCYRQPPQLHHGQPY